MTIVDWHCQKRQLKICQVLANSFRNESSVDIALTSNQLSHICDDLNRKCAESGNEIKLSDVFQVVVDGVKLILEKEQVEFIASHGIQYVAIKHCF